MITALAPEPLLAPLARFAPAAGGGAAGAADAQLAVDAICRLLLKLLVHRSCEEDDDYGPHEEAADAARRDALRSPSAFDAIGPLLAASRSAADRGARPLALGAACDAMRVLAALMQQESRDAFREECPPPPSGPAARVAREHALVQALAELAASPKGDDGRLTRPALCAIELLGAMVFDDGDAERAVADAAQRDAALAPALVAAMM
ncbi:hypothetical protein MNEG_15512 [Monoraphidium neglectum]|uniref:Uncharacterized protein n=1 Tax=Monoraphidium neglectum TaxID=145388 RepID=A0A0D2IWT8_9CHLO|nr:hypothetical protein MNEG_15512 [Monoraphidium neglectum]KIY92452.1 hypothetical protein MNEG_15512 [Monoraphidium neglectum]|eukprot:XP_013891472.1 hypothetical protein MNEG_15512 [Monoraphidium neglectum]